MQKPYILTLNGGSSSLKFAVFEAGERRLRGSIERIGMSGTRMSVDGAAVRCPKLDQSAAPGFLLDWLERQPLFPLIGAVGHRVVHGMRHTQPELVSAKLLAKLRRISPYDPEHMPHEIALLEAVRRRYPKLPQVACFDTAFHRTMPRVAKLLPLPRRYQAKGVERYGFHGLSYAYLVEELTRLQGKRGRVILAHLGSGASLAAVRDGICQETTMGFTPSAGVMMSTRTGDLDPGLVYYLARTERMTAAGFQRLVNHESGLLGVSGSSGDIRDLCAREAEDPRAGEAVELFCYQVRKTIGALTAVLGGLDTLVFSAGIGENSPLIRQRICHGLEYLGLTVDARRNQRQAAVISKPNGTVTVRVLRTDEEMMIARSTGRLLQEVR
ncbi:MAG: acetate/propionate family kinase [Bryobacteraceae bacterium]|nr:acetate/propionate family kinase [Bryobacteraceae bacterium]